MAVNNLEGLVNFDEVFCQVLILRGKDIALLGKRDVFWSRIRDNGLSHRWYYRLQRLRSAICVIYNLLDGIKCK